ncbi:hypothetical protein N7454_007010 [Penicillium verhagenii]|nr:hypothetical protein N7454_007010 [Penicillium verhagenii]
MIIDRRQRSQSQMSEPSNTDRMTSLAHATDSRPSPNPDLAAWHRSPALRRVLALKENYRRPLFRRWSTAVKPAHFHPDSMLQRPGTTGHLE